ncbi:2-oxoglutarate dehydrogenase E1 subunit family protein [Paraburkholderia sp. MM6662-R1]|uniref:2-oxoglutarate dehydrogenase E1 subunit family protein n=1 Tax=Paraburkholderia sp. MM6662-R1 TaxID=2991066 RepID=UPI003D192747
MPIIPSSALNATYVPFLEDVYDRYQTDPDSVDPSWAFPTNDGLPTHCVGTGIKLRKQVPCWRPKMERSQRCGRGPRRRSGSASGGIATLRTVLRRVERRVGSR